MPVNQETNKDINLFIDQIKPVKRQEELLRLLSYMEQWTAEQPKIWGMSIIGFGKFTRKRKTGKSFEWFKVGASANAKGLTLYLMLNLKREPLLSKLGTHSNGSACLYIKSLEEINLEVLKQLVLKSLDAVQKEMIND